MSFTRADIDHMREAFRMYAGSGGRTSFTLADFNARADIDHVQKAFRMYARSGGRTSVTLADFDCMPEAFRTYARIRSDWHERFDGYFRHIDLLKSCLLGRLLMGGDPLPMPPPLAYAAPWYDLIEEQGVDLDSSDVSIHERAVRIAHDGRWAIEDSAPSDGFALRYTFETALGRHVDWGAWSLTRRDNGWRLQRIDATRGLPRH